MTGTQIRLSSLLDDHQSSYVTALGEKKEKKRKKPESHSLI
jgi:hypothetical protein